VPVGTATGGMTFWPNVMLFVPDTTGSEIWTFNVDTTTGTLTQAGAPLAVPSPPLQLTFVDPLYQSQ